MAVSARRSEGGRALPSPLRRLAAVLPPWSRPRDAAGPFRVVRSFAVRGGAVIALIAAVGGWGGGRILCDTLLDRDAETMMLLLNSIATVEGAESYFEAGRTSGRDDLAEFFLHLSRLPSVLRTNLYGRDRRLLWSSDPTLTEHDLPANPELEEAFGGEAVAEAGWAEADDKEEHEGLAEPGTFFVENYLPIWSQRRRSEVIGIAEVYRTPANLEAAIRQARIAVWLGSIAAAAILYVTLVGIVRRAAHVMATQERELAETRTLAALGEMASAVAHGLRNPLASIRSAAEIALEGPPEPDPATAPLLRDIVADADRLEEWVRAYLNIARNGDGVTPVARGDAGAVLARCLDEAEAQCRRRGVRVERGIEPALPPMAGHPLLVGQIVGGLVANALEATPAGGGVLRAAARRVAGGVEIAVRDEGPGMDPAALARAFEPFRTSKPHGLGLGLPLAREAARRMGGRLELESRPGRGTTARLFLPEASA